MDAEVLVSIETNKPGQIAYYAKGCRFNALARSEDGEPIPKHSEVVIKTFFVTEHADEKLRRLKKDTGDDELKLEHEEKQSIDTNSDLAVE